jgi:hypothetical protein
MANALAQTMRTVFSDIMIGGAILPSILHQDPRYFYQGTGTTKSRMLHALSTPLITRGDSGYRQPNYSALGGYLSAGALANTYYPQSNRGVGLLLSTTFIDIGSATWSKGSYRNSSCAGSPLQPKANLS